jgi:hypothetical protein
MTKEMRIETNENDKKQIVRIVIIAGAVAAGIIAAIIAYQVVLGIQQEDERIRLEREAENDRIRLEHKEQAQARAEEQAYCEQWSMEIEQRRTELSGEFIQTDQEWAIFGEQVDAYNARCAY